MFHFINELIWSIIFICVFIILPAYIFYKTFKSLRRIIFQKISGQNDLIWDFQRVLVSFLTISFCIIIYIFIHDYAEITPEGSNLYSFLAYSSIYPILITFYLFTIHYWYYKKVYKSESQFKNEIKKNLILEYSQFKTFLTITLLFTIIWIVFVWFGWLVSGLGSALS